MIGKVRETLALAALYRDFEVSLKNLLKRAGVKDCHLGVPVGVSAGAGG